MRGTMFGVFKTLVYNSVDMYIFLMFFVCVNAQDSAQYLESAIKDLASLNQRPNQRRMDYFKTARKQAMPVLHPSKEDLAQLYGAAVRNGDTVKIHTDTGGPALNAAVYELDDGTKRQQQEDDTSAYYFYYYPLKAFLDELTSGQKEPDTFKDHNAESSDTFVHEVATMKSPQHQYHTHTHQHNIHILDSKTPAAEDKKTQKHLEPLFMAISGFIGMTIMFVLSALILPKIGVIKSRGVKESAEITSMTRVILQAIEGYDCSERFACEFGKTARALNIHNNRFVKLIRRIGPVSLSKRLYDINKYSQKKYKCAVIQCKTKGQVQQPKKSKAGKS